MKKTAVILIIIFSICVISGCNSSGAGRSKSSGGSSTGGSSTGGSGSGSSAIGTIKTFWAQKATDNTWYSLTAELLASNSRCDVWAQQGSGVSNSTAQNVANTYNNNYTKMISNFGITFNTGSGLKDTMQYADWWMGNGDGKLCILLLDIIDNYSVNNKAYVAGYFQPMNFFNTNYSNNCDMIYIDTYPGLQSENINSAYRTLFHEMQHLMNFTTTLAKRSNIVGNDIIALNEMDLWIDEGLSTAAEWVYSGNHDNGRLGWYNSDPTGLIGKGNNFFLWDNRTGSGEDKHENAVLDDYATVYLFFQWLRIQSSSNIYKSIISSSNSDYKAVTKAASDNNMSYASTKSGWGNMLRDWYAANYINSNSGRYGYKNETTLRRTTSGNPITVHYVPAGKTSIDLYSGEGVYSAADGYTVPGASGNILYSGLNNSTIVASGASVTGALLTYNIDDNSNIETAASISGTTTGTAANILASGSRSVQSVQINNPFPVGFSDMLRRNGYSGGSLITAPLYHESFDEW